VSNAAARELFALVESFFVEYLPRQRGASRHTVRAYRDALKLLFEFAARLSNGKQSGPRIGIEKGPLTGLGAGLSR
jgi:site-specific recombinase XerC